MARSSAQASPPALAALLAASLLAGAVLATSGVPGLNWGLATMGIESHGGGSPVRLVPQTGAGVKVAIIDMGKFDRLHPYYAANVKWCTDVFRNTQGNGACHDGSPEVSRDHGTHVAGLVKQVAPGADLYLISLKAVTPTTASLNPLTPPSGPDRPPASVTARYEHLRMIREAIWVAAEGPSLTDTTDGAKVVVIPVAAYNNPDGSPARGIALAELQTLLDAANLPGERPLLPPGVTVIAAAGNLALHMVEASWAHYGAIPTAATDLGQGPGTIAYPAAHPGVIAVAALGSVTGNRARMAEYSAEGLNDGNAAIGLGEIDVTAPGTALPSTLPSGATGLGSGTSQASGLVGGLAALYFQKFPTKGPADFRAALRCASDLNGVGKGTSAGFDKASGWGLAVAGPILSGNPC